MLSAHITTFTCPGIFRTFKNRTTLIVHSNTLFVVQNGTKTISRTGHLAGEMAHKNPKNQN